MSTAGVSTRQKTSQETNNGTIQSKETKNIRKEIEERLKDAQIRLDEEKHRKYPWE
jgi:hypothetical protein